MTNKGTYTHARGKTVNASRNDLSGKSTPQKMIKYPSVPLYPGSGIKTRRTTQMRTPMQVLPLKSEKNLHKTSASRSFVTIDDNWDQVTPRTLITGFLENTSSASSKKSPKKQRTAPSELMIPTPSVIKTKQFDQLTKLTPSNLLTPRTNILNLLNSGHEQTPATRPQDDSHSHVSSQGKHISMYNLSEWGQEVSISPMHRRKSSRNSEAHEENESDYSHEWRQTKKRGIDRAPFYIPVPSPKADHLGKDSELNYSPLVTKKSSSKPALPANSSDKDEMSDGSDDQNKIIVTRNSRRMSKTLRNSEESWGNRNQSNEIDEQIMKAKEQSERGISMLSNKRNSPLKDKMNSENEKEESQKQSDSLAQMASLPEHRSLISDGIVGCDTERKSRSTSQTKFPSLFQSPQKNELTIDSETRSLNKSSIKRTHLKSLELNSPNSVYNLPEDSSEEDTLVASKDKKRRRSSALKDGSKVNTSSVTPQSQKKRRASDTLSSSRKFPHTNFSTIKSVIQTKEILGDIVISSDDINWNEIPRSSTPSVRSKTFFHSTKGQSLMDCFLSNNASLTFSGKRSEMEPLVDISPIRPDKLSTHVVQIDKSSTLVPGKEKMKDVPDIEDELILQEVEKIVDKELDTDSSDDDFGDLETPKIDMNKKACISTTQKSSAQKQQNLKQADKETAPAVRKKLGPRKRQPSHTTIPRRSVKYFAERHSSMKLSPDAIDEIETASETFWVDMFKSLEAYSLHAGRKSINMKDVVLLMKTQRLIKHTSDLHHLIREYLPLEIRSELIPMAKARKST